MFRLAKYLKPYIISLLIAVVLLFAQANFDLALPDYLSRIVNIGIQQGGVENAVPEAIRESQMGRLILFMSSADKALMLEHYTLADTSSENYDELLAKYPQIEFQSIYVLDKIDNSGMDQLNLIMGKPILVVSFIEQIMEDPSKAEELGAGADLGFDLSMLPAGMDLLALLGQMPETQRTEMADMTSQQFAALGESMITQMAVLPVKAEYKALGMDIGKLQNQYILRIGGIMLLLTLLSVATTIAVGFIASRTAAGVARDTRKDLFSKVESFSSAEYNQFSTASLITRTTNDITQIQMVIVMMVRIVFYAPIMGVGGVIRAMSKGSSMWWIIAVAVVALISLVLIVFSIALPKFKIIQKLIDRLNLVARENLSGMMVIRAFNTQKFEEDRFDNANVDLTAVSLFINRVMVIMMPIMMFLMSGISLLIIWVGAHEVAEANMQVGDMMAFMQYAMQIVMSFLMLTMMFIFIPRASVSADRIADVLETELTIKDPEEPKSFSDSFKGAIEFRNVSFRYPGADTDVLHDISFTAKSGEMTAFIGSTGSGKSTVINLVPRFFDVSVGSILVDGIDIREVRQHDLREKIGYVPQKGTLFSGTIESNLRYADENASDETLKLATEIAQAAEFINDNPDGLLADISQGGTNVSGGQKQRLSIARAMVKKPPIYIFDDSFSALDFKTDAALRKALKENTSDSTLLLVTQRVSTIKNAEQIVVLEEGKIVGKGTHDELMDTCETYQEIALSQLSMEELK